MPRPVLSLLLAVLAAVAALPGVAWAGAAAQYALGAGDTVAIQVFDEPELSREAARITEGCTLELQLIGPVEVCGRTPVEVQETIRAKLSEGFMVDPKVLVTLIELGSKRVEVKGAVKRPGVQVIEGPTPLSQIVTQAGGPASSNVIEVTLVKADNSANVRSYLLAELDLSSDPVMVEAGDTVILKLPVNVYVQGEVEKAGAVPFTQGLTATQALTLAGGPTAYAGLGRAYILRSTGERVNINLRRITNGQEADVALMPNDKLVIQKSLF